MSSRASLAIEVECSITADDVANLLDRLAAERSVPCFLGCDNAPEFAANAIRDRCRFNAWASVYIDPSSSRHNDWIESFNSRLRAEFLSGHLFDTLVGVRVLLADWRDEHNDEHLHSSRGYLAPVEFNDAWNQQHQPRPSLARAHYPGSRSLTPSCDDAGPSADQRPRRPALDSLRNVDSPRMEREMIHGRSPFKNALSRRATTDGISPAGTAGAKRNPWARSTPRPTKSSNSSLVSTPSASTSIPS